MPRCYHHIAAANPRAGQEAEAHGADPEAVTDQCVRHARCSVVAARLPRRSPVGVSPRIALCPMLRRR
jgi:hypothetical protein